MVRLLDCELLLSLRGLSVSSGCAVLAGGCGGCNVVDFGRAGRPTGPDAAHRIAELRRRHDTAHHRVVRELLLRRRVLVVLEAALAFIAAGA